MIRRRLLAKLRREQLLFQCAMLMCNTTRILYNSFIFMLLMKVVMKPDYENVCRLEWFKKEIILQLLRVMLQLLCCCFHYQHINYYSRYYIWCYYALLASATTHANIFAFTTNTSPIITITYYSFAYHGTPTTITAWIPLPQLLPQIPLPLQPLLPLPLASPEHNIEINYPFRISIFYNYFFQHF